jgi:hypothetical protein
LISAIFSVENLLPLNLVLEGVRDIALFYYPLCTDSVKLSLKFSYNFTDFNACIDHYFSTYLNIMTRGVKCGVAAKKMPVLYFCVVMPALLSVNS